jgi:regulator of replication initiation timing
MVESALRKSQRVKPPTSRSEVDENQTSAVKKQQPQHNHEPHHHQYSNCRRSSSRHKRTVAVHHIVTNNSNIKNSAENVVTAELEKEMMQNIVLGQRQHQQRRTSALGHTCLDSIKSHKNVIAEMRPTRRKIKWQSNISDWERSSNANQKNNYNKKKQTGARISVGLNLEDLHILGAPKKTSEEEEEEEQQLNEASMLDLGCNLGDSVDDLEDNIELLFATIRRLSKEVDELDEQAEQLRVQNAALRQQVVNCLPVIPQKTPSAARRRTCPQLTHTVERFKEKSCEMNEQIALLNLQRRETEQATAALLLELAAEKKKGDKVTTAGEEEEEEEGGGGGGDCPIFDDDDDVDNHKFDQAYDNQETSAAVAATAPATASASSKVGGIISVDQEVDERNIAQFATLEYLQYFGMEPLPSAAAASGNGIISSAS